RVLRRPSSRTVVPSPRLSRSRGRMGQGLRDDDWLASLRGRLAVPGGSSPADIPSYYAWQIKPQETRVQDLREWISPFLPRYSGLDRKTIRLNSRHVKTPSADF